MAPAGLGLVGVLPPGLFQFTGVKSLKFHGAFSFQIGVQQLQQAVQPLPLQQEQLALAPQGLLFVVLRVSQDVTNLFQWKIQFPVKQDLLHFLHIRRSVPAVAGICRCFRAEQADVVVMMQGADTHPGQLCHFADGQSHVPHLTLECKL